MDMEMCFSKTCTCADNCVHETTSIRSVVPGAAPRGPVWPTRTAESIARAPAAMLSRQGPFQLAELEKEHRSASPCLVPAKRPGPSYVRIDMG